MLASVAQVDSFGQLLRAVEAVAARPRVVAISGFGGSGKTTLAERLCDHFGLRTLQVLSTDAMYSANPHGKGLFDMTDWGLVTRVLGGARACERLQYEARLYDGQSFTVDEPMPAVLIIEGIRLLRPELMSFYDVSVWMDCPQELAMQRAKARNRAQGDAEAEIALWDTLWGPLDAEYVRAYTPAALATVLYPSA